MSERMKYNRQPATPGRVCKEDPAHSKRPAPHPGPRCTSCHNAEKRARRLRAAGRRVERNFGLSPEQYDALYEFQGGRCAICRRASGATKRLAVDHDHHQAMLDGHDPDKGCPKCVRGLVCGPCNDVLAHFRSSPEAGLRLAQYLVSWPTHRARSGLKWPPPAATVPVW